MENKVLMLEPLNVGIQPLFPMRVAGFVCILLNIVALFQPCSSSWDRGTRHQDRDSTRPSALWTHWC